MILFVIDWNFEIILTDQWDYSLPDSLGDDLILEVNDSKGNNYGRVLVQVATISEDPVSSNELSFHF